MVGTGGCLLACAAAAGRRPGVTQARVLKRNGHNLEHEGHAMMVHFDVI